MFLPYSFLPSSLSLPSARMCPLPALGWLVDWLVEQAGSAGGGQEAKQAYKPGTTLLLSGLRTNLS